MTTESKTFFQKYWQAILIAVSINVIIGIATNVGAYKVVLFKLDQTMNRTEIQGQSIFELQQNQMYISAKENLDLPNSFTQARGKI